MSSRGRLFTAIEAGRFSEVVAMLDAGPSLLEAVGSATVLTRDKTPLMYALQCHASQIARELVARGGNVNARSRAGARRCSRRARMIELFMARGADPDRLVGTTGNTTRQLVHINAGTYSAEVLHLFGAQPTKAE